jgi:hypothetical protein
VLYLHYYLLHPYRMFGKEAPKRTSLQKAIDAYDRRPADDLEGAATGTVRSAILEGGQYFDSLAASLRDSEIPTEALSRMAEELEAQVFESIVDTQEKPRGLARLTGSNARKAEEQFARMDELSHLIFIQIQARGGHERHRPDEPDTDKFREFKATIQNTLDQNRAVFEDQIMKGLLRCAEYIKQNPDGKFKMMELIGQVEEAPQIDIKLPASVAKPVGEVITLIHRMGYRQEYTDPIENIITDWMRSNFGLGGTGSTFYVGPYGYSRTFSFHPDDGEKLIEALWHSKHSKASDDQLSELRTLFHENWKRRAADYRTPLAEWIKQKQKESNS